MSFGFRSKLILAFFLFNAVVSTVLSISAYRVLHASMLKEIQERTKNIAQLSSYLIDKPTLKRLIHKMSPGLTDQEASAVEQSADFHSLSAQLNRVRDVENRLIRYAYIVHPADDGISRFVADADTLSDLRARDGRKRPAAEISRFNSPFDTSTFPVFHRAVQRKEYLVEKEFFFDPVYKVRSITAYAPIIDETSNALLAVLCIDIVDANVEGSLRESRSLSLIIIGVSLLLSLTISIILGNIVAKSILALDQVVQQYSQRDFSARSLIRSKDEIGRLGFSLNFMAETIQDYATRLENLLAAYSRFVPKHFLHFLNKKSITDVQLGDQIQKEMTILFSDIRSFTTLSEGMTPAENFNFINSYLRRVGPVIRLHNGFIDKYIGDGIMALFPTDPDDAVMAAIDMIRKVGEYNVHRRSSGYQPIRIGIGIHTGLLMLGTIGEDERMDGSVISDAVNLCSRMEGLSKIYGGSILISKETLDKLKDPEKYHIRYLDKVRVKGKSVPISVYEVYTADPPDVLEKKDMSKEPLAQGIAFYYDRKFHEALAHFTSLHRDSPEDTVIRLYMTRCEINIRYGIPDDWIGVEVMESK